MLLGRLGQSALLIPIRLLTQIWQLLSTVKTLITSKDKKNPDRCLPLAKARSLSKSERAATARKKKREGKKGKTVVKNTKRATVKNMSRGGGVRQEIAKGCGAVLNERRKVTTYT